MSKTRLWCGREAFTYTGVFEGKEPGGMGKWRGCMDQWMNDSLHAGNDGVGRALCHARQPGISVDCLLVNA